jgi:MFS family permease
MSSLEAGADDFAYEEPAETKPLVPATPRELKRLIKDWRSGRATRNVVQAMGDAYVAVFAAVMIGAMVVNVILKAQRTIAQCSSVTCLSARAILPWAAFATTIAVALAASRLFGPVLASAAEGFWLLEAPISRAKLLRSRLVAAVVAAFLGGAVIGTLISALTGSALIEVLVWAAATALSAAASVAFAAAQQGIERHRLTHVATYLFGLLAVGALFSVIGVAAGWFSFGLSENVGIELGLIMIAASMLGLLISAVLAGLRLAQIRRARLMSGGALVSGISGAFFALDIGLAHDIVVERRAIERGHVHPKRGKGLGLQALIWREWQRLWRFPQPLLVLAATIVVPYAADALGMSTLTPVLAALALFGATVPLLGGLRVLTRTGGLARCLPFSLARIKLASIAVPAILAGIWAAATVPAYLGFGDGALQRPVQEAALIAIATGAAGLLAAVRWTQAKGVDFGAPMVASQAGAFPPGLVTNLFRGFDVCIITTAPLLLGGSPWWSLGIAAIAAVILLNSMDAETLRARQAEQQKQLAAQKKERADAATAAKQRKR